ADLEAATGALRPGAAGLGRATPDVRGVFTEAPRPFGKVPDFADEAKPSVDDLQDTFADLQPFVPRLGEGIYQAGRSLKVYKPYARDIGTTITDIASSFTLHQGWTHQLRVFLVPPTLTSVHDMPIADAKNPYPAPGQAYFDRDKDGAFIPGDIGARKAGK
ncbi:MAG TPA: MCE family protein, partial [Pseudonocardia sp.]